MEVIQKGNTVGKDREIGYVGMEWINLAEGRDQWSALVNTVMNLGFHNIFGNS
jgi:hypothetical protein